MYAYTTNSQADGSSNFNPGNFYIKFPETLCCKLEAKYNV